MRDIKLAGIVQGQEEIDAVNRVLHSDWHVSGPECEALQKEIAEKIGVKYCVVVNSGSAANLLALQALNLPKGAKVLTSACGFPATLNPILHLGHTPVFVDYLLKTLQADILQVEELIDGFGVFSNNTSQIQAVLLAHTLGSSLNMFRLKAVCDQYDIPIIEDCCEAMGTKYEGQYVGSIGKVGTFSFYSSHQISGLGGGGAVVTNDQNIYEQCKSLRDWGKQNVREGYICTKMDTKVGDIPYDQQYTYDTVGYNMRMPDANCAYAREQLKRLDNFATKRRDNYNLLQTLLQVEDLPLHYMDIDKCIEPASFGFPVVLKEPGLRDKMVEYLESKGIHVRLFFAGNILRHKPYVGIGDCNNYPIADYLMNNAFFCGCWPGLDRNDMCYIAHYISEFFWENS